MASPVTMDIDRHSAIDTLLPFETPRQPGHVAAAGLMALKLPKEEREKFLRKYATTLFEAYGIIQKEFVTVPDVLLRRTAELKTWLDASYVYVRTLKPKPTRKKA